MTVASTADRAARRQPREAGRTRLLALVAVLGPGLLAGLSDDDPAGITTYSVLGAQYGYEGSSGFRVRVLRSAAGNGCGS